MKTRNDFVSNSSSSSFIIIANSGTDRTDDIKSDFMSYKDDWTSYPIPNTIGKHEFGWEWEDTNSFEGKLNFVGIQLLYLFIEKISNEDRKYYRPYTGKDFDRLYDMLKKVCKERFGFNVRLNPDIINTEIGFSEDRGGYYGFTTLATGFYIDHQSASSEGSCMEMFDSEDALYNFLRFDESYIQGGNDNG